ncbi:hypothetical protein D2E26_1064 [Bifidobacterium dolichotidis]|uniref:Lipoprotein n=1 Tax=Bifidobacterium dolichotidis TaxID=2306976 RepID=A0A430FQA3_9BIFI|nr:hypothetical protein [Bifidobacterium dolichotidis]RSX55010.1 hypothetical protein D2E26_1064 [Bifidobacterium dolichotidis]
MRSKVLKKIACVCIPLLLAVNCSACGDQTTSKSSDTSSNSSTHFDISSYHSASEYIKGVLTTFKQQISDPQREVLERALEHDGQVSDTDYHNAWQQYSKCLVDKGYNPPPLQLDSGIYRSGIFLDANLPEEQRTKVSKDAKACDLETKSFVNAAYLVSKGNSQVTGYPNDIVDCLHKRNLVSDSYTANQFNEEESQFNNTSDRSFSELIQQGQTPFSFDIASQDAQYCLALSGAKHLLKEDSIEWHPFG